MVLVPLASLVHVDDAVPGVRVETSAPATDPDLDRAAPRAASRSGARSSLASPVFDESTTTTAAPTTTAPPAPPQTVQVAAVRPAPTTTHTHPSSTTTARPKPTTTTAKPTTTTAKPTTTTTPANRQEGDASFYSPDDPAECAHRTLPFGTVLTVTSLENGAKTTCRVGDRGPFVEGRIVDLSQARFADLAPVSEGVVRVRIEW
ncbi:MAG TPA: septal ring lytic transglycosylase RlpA family protein [Acidimicrobiales bacterium]